MGHLIISDNYLYCIYQNSHQLEFIKDLTWTPIFYENAYYLKSFESVNAVAVL